jgi:peptide deformylase
VISYFDVEKGEMVSETVSGFTAVIFQHEVDHLDGIIYTDRVLM